MEVYVNGDWGTVCDDGWGINDAMVVCSQLGFGEGEMRLLLAKMIMKYVHLATFLVSICIYILIAIATSAPGQAAYGQGTGDITLDDVACTGTETNIFDCPHSGVGIHNCAHSEDAGAVCESTYIV